MTVEKATGVGMYTSQAYVSNQDNNTEKSNTVENKDTGNATGQNKESVEKPIEKPVTLSDYATDDKTTDDKEYEVDQQVLHERIQKALDNYSSRMGNFEAKFGVHEETNRVMIKLVDKDTKEVLKEIPPEKTLDMIAKCLEIAGVLVDEKI